MKCGLCTSSMNVSGNLSEMRYHKSHPRATKSETVRTGDSDAHCALRTTALGLIVSYKRDLEKDMNLPRITHPVSNRARAT